MEIDQDGNVTVPEADSNSFRDGRLPLAVRLRMAAVYFISDAWSHRHFSDVAKLFQEAADRAESEETALDVRLSSMRNMVDWVRIYKERSEFLEQRLNDAMNEIHRLSIKVREVEGGFNG